MSLHFILDGYNIIRRTKKFDLADLRDSRDSLINFLLIEHPEGSPKNKITIVFDGKADILYHQNKGSIKIIFSENESADDLIRKIIAKLDNKKNICLVTDDNGLALSVRSLGVKILSVADFISKAKSNKRNFNSSAIDALSYSQKDAINKELSKIWFKDEKK